MWLFLNKWWFLLLQKLDRFTLPFNIILYYRRFVYELLTEINDQNHHLQHLNQCHLKIQTTNLFTSFLTKWWLTVLCGKFSWKIRTVAQAQSWMRYRKSTISILSSSVYFFYNVFEYTFINSSTNCLFNINQKKCSHFFPSQKCHFFLHKKYHFFVFHSWNHFVKN